MIEEQRIKTLETEVGDIKSLLRKILDPEGKLDVNLTVEEMLVHVTNTGKKTINVDTSSLPGRVLFCALKDMPSVGTVFRESDISRMLDERGWHSPHSSLSSQLSKMVGTTLVKEKDGYRLPSKVTFTGDEL
jgi:hypothetical protein